MKNIKYLIVLLFFTSCATYKTQYGEHSSDWKNSIIHKDKPIYTVYLIGDAGQIDENGVNIVTKAVGDKLKTESKNSTLIYLGDNIYSNGFPDIKSKERQEAEKILDAQIDIVKDYKGKTIFIYGNHDLRQGFKGINRQEKYIENALKNDKVFLPKKGCPLQKVKVNDDVVIIAINSQWYLENWDKNPKINDNCDIKTRAKFFDELESLIKKSEGKTTIIAMHHPIYSNGSHGGYFSAKQHLYPLPILGSLASLIRKTGGVSPQDLQNKRYLEFRKRIIALARYNSKIIFVSGHEHNLQFIHKNNITQIISGSGAKKSAVRNNVKGFAYPDLGYVKLSIFSDGSSKAQFFGVDSLSDKLVYETMLFPIKNEVKTKEYANDFPEFVESSIYKDKETKKRKFYKMLWGKRYRKYYSTKIKAKTVNLDTLFGGLKPKRKGGGHQSVSLILKNKEGKEYVMRAMRKSAIKYIQTTGFKNQNIDNDFNNTATEKLIQDIFTASHPYAPYTIATLSDALNIYHTNANLYYVPKQKALQGYNTSYGDALYMIEERATSGHGNLKNFGYSNKIISTDDLLKKLRKSDKYGLDQTAYIKARLFDMVIGDWDRHQDQWRWAEFKNYDGSIIFRPVPRDRDQAFSIMGDGLLLKIAGKVLPLSRLLQPYDDELKNPKWINLEPYPLDMTFINGTDKAVWDKQVKFIKDNLTESVIDSAFTYFPDEVKDETISIIKQKLLGRINNLQHISDSYYNTIHKNVVLKGTDKKDYFEIIRLNEGKTKIIAYRKNKKGKIYYNHVFSHKITKEILIYGLDDDDFFEVSGKGSKLIPLQLIGGQNHDIYNIINGEKVVITDYKSKKSTFITHKGKRRLTDDYQKNVYNYRNATYNMNQILPMFGFNKDDGFKIGLTDIFTDKSFNKSHFIEKQKLTTNFFTDTNGFEFIYKGDFKKVFGNFNLNIDATLTSPKYTLNFFGFGNETVNKDKIYNLDYNRVKLKTIAFSPSLISKGVSGSMTKFTFSYEVLEIQKTPNRFIEDANLSNIIPNTIFNNQNYIEADFMYSFENTDNKAFPTLGLNTSIQFGYKNNLDTNKSFSYIVPTFGFDYKLNTKGSLVLATKLKAHINFNTNYEFYHAASIGADDGLRGFRKQRFTGKSSFYQNIDLRYKFNKVKTGLMPIKIGVYSGFDYGRVWLNQDNSTLWHTSIGGGLIINMVDLMSFKLGIFNSNEDTLFSFGLNLDF